MGRAILAHLMTTARELGYQRLILETGNKQAPAIAFYETLGFRRIGPFGEQVNNRWKGPRTAAGCALGPTFTLRQRRIRPGLGGIANASTSPQLRML